MWIFHSSKAIVEEAGVQTGSFFFSFFFSSANLSSDVRSWYPGGLLLYLLICTAFMCFSPHVGLLNHQNARLLSDFVFFLGIPTQPEGSCLVPLFAGYPHDLGETDCSHSPAHSFTEVMSLYIHFSSFLSALVLVAGFLSLKSLVTVCTVCISEWQGVMMSLYLGRLPSADCVTIAMTASFLDWERYLKAVTFFSCVFFSVDCVKGTPCCVSLVRAEPCKRPIQAQNGLW